jgi:hypothetical protein
MADVRERKGDSPGCGGLIGLTEEELSRRLGEPVARRALGKDTWLVFRSADLSLRVRCAGAQPARAASWTATFTTGHTHLRDAAQALGLWPAAAPDHEAASSGAPLIRRALPCPDSGRVHSLTATIRGDVFTALSAFDESPDWL